MSGRVQHTRGGRWRPKHSRPAAEAGFCRIAILTVALIRGAAPRIFAPFVFFTRRPQGNPPLGQMPPLWCKWIGADFLKPAASGRRLQKTCTCGHGGLAGARPRSGGLSNPRARGPLCCTKPTYSGKLACGNSPLKKNQYQRHRFDSLTAPARQWHHLRGRERSQGVGVTARITHDGPDLSTMPACARRSMVCALTPSQ